MSDDVSADLIEQAAKALCKIRCIHWEPQKPERLCRTNDGLARAVLGALDLPGLLNAAKAEALREAADEMDELQTPENDDLAHRDPALWLTLRADRIDPDEEGNDRG